NGPARSFELWSRARSLRFHDVPVIVEPACIVIGEKRGHRFDQRCRAVSRHVQWMPSAISEIRPDENGVISHGQRTQVRNEAWPGWRVKQIKLDVRRVESR